MVLPYARCEVYAWLSITIRRHIDILLVHILNNLGLIFLDKLKDCLIMILIIVIRMHY